MKHRCEEAAAEPEWAGARPVGEHDRGRPVAVALGTDNRPVPCGRRATCTRAGRSGKSRSCREGRGGPGGPLWGAWLRLAGAGLMLDTPLGAWLRLAGAGQAVPSRSPP